MILGCRCIESEACLTCASRLANHVGLSEFGDPFIGCYYISLFAQNSDMLAVTVCLCLHTRVYVHDGQINSKADIPNPDLLEALLPHVRVVNTNSLRNRCFLVFIF